MAKLTPDSLEEVFADRDQTNFDGHRLVLQPSQSREQVLNLLLDVWRLVDDQPERDRVELDRTSSTDIAPRISG
jgi:hypothetical protein